MVHSGTDKNTDVRIMHLQPITDDTKTGCCCCMGKNNGNNKHIDDDVKKLANKSLIFGILAITSTMSFYFGYFIIDSIGHILQIDSFVNSLCIVAAFQWEMDKFFHRYVFWFYYLKYENNVERMESTANSKDGIPSTSPATKSVGSISMIVVDKPTSSQTDK